MDPRLRGERQGVHAVVSQGLSVSRNAVCIGCEDEVELPGGAEKVVEVRWVLLVPERGRNPLGTAVLKEVAQWIVLHVFVPNNPLPPPSVVAPPGRLDEQKRRARLLHLGSPVLRRHQQEVRLILEGVLGERVEDGGHRWAAGPRRWQIQRREVDELRGVQVRPLRERMGAAGLVLAEGCPAGRVDFER